jgi:hypothetical protein
MPAAPCSCPRRWSKRQSPEGVTSSLTYYLGLVALRRASPDCGDGDGDGHRRSEAAPGVGLKPGDHFPHTAGRLPPVPGGSRRPPGPHIDPAASRYLRRGGFRRIDGSRTGRRQALKRLGSLMTVEPTAKMQHRLHLPKKLPVGRAGAIAPS